MAKDLRTYLSNQRTRLPRLILTGAAVAQIARLHEENGGATFSLYFGSVLGHELFAVSLYPERSVQVRGRFVPARWLQAFIVQGQGLLNDPRIAVGIWYNEEDDLTCLDVTAILPNRDQAIELARRYNQIAIYDLLRGEEILTGGTGDPVPDAPPEMERLPQPPR
jgi:hypothetical protein